MRLWSSKRYRDMTPDEQRRYQALCRLDDRSRLFYLLFIHGLTGIYHRFTNWQMPFAVLSAQPASDALLPWYEQWRRDREKTTRLRTHIKDMGGLGYLPASSVWLRQEAEMLTPDAMFVPGLGRDVTIELGRSYDQAEVIWSSGPEFWKISSATGNQAGPFPTSSRLRRLVLEDILEWEVPEIRRSGPLTKLVVAPGRRGFFFWRAGGGLITCGMAPCGLSVHDVISGSKLHADYDDHFMEMGSIDGYLPL